MNNYSSGGDGTPAVYADMLQRNITPYVATQVSSHTAKVKICENTKTPQQFQDKYEDLKSRNVRNLEPLVFLLSKLAEDGKTKTALERQVTSRSIRSTPVSSRTSAAAAAASPGGGAGGSGAGGSAASAQRHQRNQSGGGGGAAAVVTGGMSKVELNDVATVLKKEYQKSTTNILKSASIPDQPEWLFTKNYQSYDYPYKNIVKIQEDIGSYSIEIQESLILKDMLNLLQGIDGVYIQSKELTDHLSPRTFSMDASLDILHREQVNRLLPLCSDFSVIVRYTKQKSAFEYGMVNQALSASLDVLIKDYIVLIEQLSYQFRLNKLSLLKLWYFMNPSLNMFSTITTITNSINKGACIGGAVLSILHEKMMNVVENSETQKLVLYLTKAACVPFFKILEKWIYKGLIQDPYSEFLIKENTSFDKAKLIDDYNGAYWKLHYTITRDNVPIFLERFIKKMLDTGKYLNAVQESGKEVDFETTPLIYSAQAVHTGYSLQIQNAHRYASKLLLDFLIDDHKLKMKLNSIRSYFLLECGDFISQFMDIADKELRKSVKNIKLERLEALVEITLSKSTANNDPYKDDLRIKFLPYDLVTQLFKILKIQNNNEKEYTADSPDLNLTGLEALSLDFDVQWPISLIINRNTLTRYQMLFRHLFYTKHVERLLNNIWHKNKASKLSANRLAFSLRQQMIHFVVTFLEFMMYEIIAPNWAVFNSKIDEAENIDDILAYQTEFLDVCLADCMLTSTQLLKNVHKIMVVCVTFANFLQRVERSTIIDQGNENYIEQEMDDSFDKSLHNFEKNFRGLVIKFIHTIAVSGQKTQKTEDIRIRLLHSLNYNDFYTEDLDKLNT